MDHESALNDVGLEPRGFFQHSADFDFGHASLLHTIRRGWLTQSLVRGRLRREGDQKVAGVLRALLDALVEIHRWPTSMEEEAMVHLRAPLRTACWPHAEAILRQASVRSASSEVQGKAARLHSELAWHLREIGQLASGEEHINASIAWGEAQTPRDERSLAICYASRAGIRRDQAIEAGKAGQPERAKMLSDAAQADIEGSTVIFDGCKSFNTRPRDREQFLPRNHTAPANCEGIRTAPSSQGDDVKWRR